MQYLPINEEAEDLRVQYIWKYDPGHNKPILKYLEENNMLVEALLQIGSKAISEPKRFSLRDFERHCREFEYNNEKYFYYEQMPGSYVMLYKILPRLYSDEQFKWKENKKYGTLECELEMGMFVFHCICKETGNAVVDVKYNRCDNKHKNRVTISRIEIDDATNVKIIRAIKQWRRHMQNDLENLECGE